MKDYVEQFRQKRLKKNVVIISLGLAFAIAINWLLFGTNIGNKLQTSVKNVNSWQQIKRPDLYLNNSWTWSDVVNLVAGNDINKASQLSFSIVSNPEALKINDIVSEDKNVELIKTTNIPGYYMIIMKFKNPQNIDINSTLLKIVYTKISNDKSSINLLETKFISNGETFDLQSGGIEF